MQEPAQPLTHLLLRLRLLLTLAWEGPAGLLDLLAQEAHTFVSGCRQLKAPSTSSWGVSTEKQLRDRL